MLEPSIWTSPIVFQTKISSVLKNLLDLNNHGSVQVNGISYNCLSKAFEKLQVFTKIKRQHPIFQYNIFSYLLRLVSRSKTYFIRDCYTLNRFQHYTFKVLKHIVQQILISEFSKVEIWSCMYICWSSFFYFSNVGLPRLELFHALKGCMHAKRILTLI